MLKGYILSLHISLRYVSSGRAGMQYPSVLDPYHRVQDRNRQCSPHKIPEALFQITIYVIKINPGRRGQLHRVPPPAFENLDAFSG